MAENILIERSDRIAIITINRPDKLNALNIQTREELSAALDELRDDAGTRVVIITGAGEKAFIAGADISEFEGRTAIEQRAVMRSRNIFTTAEEFPKPLIAMINGFCLGGGNELAMLRPPDRQRKSAVWTTRDQPRHHTRRRRHAASDAAGRRRPIDADDPDR